MELQKTENGSPDTVVAFDWLIVTVGVAELEVSELWFMVALAPETSWVAPVVDVWLPVVVVFVVVVGE